MAFELGRATLGHRLHWQIFFARTDIAARLLQHMIAQEMDEILTSEPNYRLHGHPDDPAITMFGAIIQEGGVLGVGSRGLEYLFTLNPSVTNFMVRPAAKPLLSTWDAPTRSRIKESFKMPARSPHSAFC